MIFTFLTNGLPAINPKFFGRIINRNNTLGGKRNIFT